MKPEEIYRAYCKRLGKKVAEDNIFLDRYLKTNCYYTQVYDHKNAKAFWGEKLCCSRCGDTPGVDNVHENERGKLTCYLCYEDLEPGNVDVPVWQFHLQKMVLEVDPLLYIEKFL